MTHVRPNARSQSSAPSAPCALWPVDLRLTHLDWNPEATLVHFQGQYLTTCELDYNTLQEEVQSEPKTQTAVDIGQFCLVEDLSSGRWYRGRVQNRSEDLFDVFLIDHGNVLSVGIAHMSSCSNNVFNLPPKIVCGFLANVLLLQGSSHSVVEDYFSSLIGRNVTGHIQAVLPDKVLLLEAPDINSDLIKHGFGRYVDTDSFLLLVEMLTEVPLKQNIEPAPDLLIEKPRGREFSFKPPGQRGYKDILSFCGPRLSPGTRVKVRVTAAVSPGLFYCQMASAHTDLWEMSKKLAALCEHRAKLRHQTTERENLGLLCAVKAKDGRWYRGCVQVLPVNSQVRVLFIDYGFFESVKVGNVHRLPSAFHSVPIEAFPCSLSSLNGQDEAAKTQQMCFLKAGLLGGLLDVEISSFDEEQHLYSITVFGAEDNHLKESEPFQNHPKEKTGLVLETEEASSQGGNSAGEASDKTLNVEAVQVDSAFVGYVVYALNPNHFWISTQKRRDEFEDMMTKLADHFHQVKLDEDILVNPERGALCCALYEKDMHFYRAVVTDILDHGVEVLFIDYGNTEKVPQMLIKRIPEVFARKAAFAFCCTLVNVFPVDEVWSSATADFFRQAVLNKALLVRVVHKRKSKFVVDLYKMGSDNSLSISELLNSSKQAEYWSLQLKSVVHSTRHVSDVNTNTEKWEKEGNTCRSEGQTAQTASFKPSRIKPGLELAVRCSCISSPSDFWCKPLDELSALEQMMKDLQQYYSTHTVPHQPGEPCCVVKCPVDRRWYRALVTDRQRGRARVLLVDYGFTVQTEEHALQGIIPEYVDLEVQAFRCSLNGRIEPTDPKNCGKWSSTVHNSLKNFVFNSPGGLTCQVFLQLNVKNKGLCNIVDLYNTQSQQSITNLLVKRGLAREATMSTKQLSTAVCFPESFIYCSYDLSPGKEEVVYVTHVGSQWEVYCHLERNSGIIEDLEKKISEDSEKMKQASGGAIVSKLCLAKYLDGKWYRGLAQPVQSLLHLSVFFVDYGNSDICEKTHVAFLPADSELLCTPMQAVRLSLASVSKGELYADAKDWLVEAVLDKQVRAVIVGKRKDGSFDVELFDGDVSINKKVDELVLSLSPQPRTAVTLKASSTKLKREISSVRERTENTKAIKAKTKTIAEIKQQNHDMTKVCVSKQPQRTCHSAKPVKQRLDFTSLSSGRPQHTTEADISQLSSLSVKKLNAGFKAKCFTSHIESVNSFFLQLSDDEPAILKMAEDLNTDLLKDSLKTTTSLGINDLVLAEFQEDGALYRSVVKKCQGTSCLIVEFIDYGNSATVDKNRVYPIPKDYRSQPRLSISCSLLDTGPYENADSFRAAVMEKPLMVEFVRRYGGRWKVKIEILDVQPVTSTGRGERVNLYDQPGSHQGVEPCEHEAAENMPAVETQSSTWKPPPLTSRVKTRFRRKPKTRTKGYSKNARKTSKAAKTERTDRTEVFVPMAIHAQDLSNSTVLSVQSKGRFYVRPAAADDLFAALQSYIADNLHKCETVAEENVKAGLCCLTQVEDKWHRAVVQHTGSGRCQVLLVDLGVTMEAACGDLRQPCSSMKEIPTLAVLCKVTLSEGEDAQESWEQTLTPLIGKEVKLVFVRYSEAQKLWMVEIVMNGLFLVGQSAASMHQNKVTLPPPTKTQNEEREPSREASPPQHLAFAPVDGGKPYFGFATAVMTPSKFCVVLEDLLLVMKTLLNERPGPTYPLPEAHLVPGTCCLFKSDSENKWCRAEILSADAGLALNLVDYGTCELLPCKDLSKLKRLPEELADLPKATYPCTLRGVKPVGVDGRWTDEAAFFFQQRLYQKSLQIFFREFALDTHWKVDIVADGVYVAKDLVDAGHASYLDPMLELRFQEQSLCKALPQDMDTEREFAVDDDSGEKSDFPVPAVEEAEGEMLLGVGSGTSQCFLM